MVPARIARRILLPVLIGLQVLVAALAVLAMVVGVLGGAIDRRWRIARIGLMAAAYVGVEWSALLALLGVWVRIPLRSREWADEANVRVLRWALDRTLVVARWVLGFRIEINDPPESRPLSEPGPVLVLARHGGIGDSIALVWLLTSRYGRRPRVALKEALAWDPFADIVLNRLGACFLPAQPRRRKSGSDLVGDLATGLRPKEALLLFPEGGNWTPGRWTRAIRRLRSEHGPDLARKAALMEHVLPPRWGGVSACLDARPDVPVVVFAHTGLDKITSTRQLWRALPFRPAMEVAWWPSLPPPHSHSERAGWLVREWAFIDEWIDARRTGSRVTTPY